MSDQVGIEFTIAVAAGSALVSGMIALRLAAGGAGARQIAGLLAEVWAVLALWVGLCLLMARAVGEPAGATWREELSDLGARLRVLGTAERWGMGMGLAGGAAGCAHVLVRLGRAMERFQPTRGREETK